MSARLVIAAQKGHADINTRLLTVSVTGHRWNKLAPNDTERLKSELRRVFGIIDHAAQSSDPPHPNRAAGRKGPIWILSGLAEGSDQLAFEVAPVAWRRGAILPFSKDRYTKDFAPDRATGGVDRRSEFTEALAQADVVVELGDTSDASLAYEAAGDQMLAVSDVLIAVWDGKKGDGPGGTESVIATAVETMPVVWIPSVGSSASTVLLTAKTLRDRERAQPGTAQTLMWHIRDVLASPLKPFAPSANGP